MARQEQTSGDRHVRPHNLPGYIRPACALVLTLAWTIVACAQVNKGKEELEQFLGKVGDLPACAHASQESPFREGIYFPNHLATPAQQKEGLRSGQLVGLDPPPYIEIAADRLACPGRLEVRTMFANFAPNPDLPLFPAIQIPCFTEKGLRVRVRGNVKSTCDETLEDERKVTLFFVQKQNPLRLECDGCESIGLPKRWIYVGKRKAFPDDMSALKALYEYFGVPKIEDNKESGSNK
ncbi:MULTISPECIES: hypothetical protein [Burkholderia]|jgi:hypothetical protein|uniref:Uncharacterized protein n=1 Tax=Burkholderia contaminans TaxID=488447 RepID=A0A250L532_9BURK|nr:MULTISPECIES: hypothetical protein [Burkholderia]UTP25039.1 hypothetical protein NMB33_32075 [Burkholderia sp. FXe9]MBH9690495.1 hypothetical protein [Burkholderia contaminans]MBK1899685.1 hypothetical protein [Burkholderia contaminans]MBK1908048.1 hypothetical protein [Burkholderia contaminans]MBK1920712.1 hypothetical protein [Burkholderia contaminans]